MPRRMPVPRPPLLLWALPAPLRRQEAPRPAEGLRELWEEPAQRRVSSADMRARRLAARWVIPVDGAPIEWGALLIGADGRIAEVGSDLVVARPPDIPAVRYDDAVILPGLIN